MSGTFLKYAIEVNYSLKINIASRKQSVIYILDKVDITHNESRR